MLARFSRIPAAVRIATSTLAVVLVATLLVGQTRPSNDVDSRAFVRRLSGVTDAFKGVCERWEDAGAVVLVAHRGKVVYHEPFGRRDRESRAPMKRDTIFRIASQTKALASVGIMMLQEQGKLSVTDPVSKYLPEFTQTTVAVRAPAGSTPGYEVVPAKRQITIHDLLTHTAGIGYGTGVASDRWKAAG